MNLRIEKLAFSKNKKQVKQIYFNAFPKKERMPFPMMIAMSLLWNTEFLAFYDGEVLCGFVYLANMFRTSFVMFFAVDEALRSKGYGGAILEAVKQRHKRNKIIVSIEPCDEDAVDLEINCRRKKFYMRNGFVESGYFIKLAGVKQEILIRNGIFSKSKFKWFFALYSNLTMYPKIWQIKQ